MATTAKKGPAKRRAPKAKAKAKKTITTKKAVTKKDVFVDLLGKLEGEVEKVVGRVNDLMNSSSRDLKDRVQDLIDKVNLDGIYNVASETKDEWEREIRRLAEDVVDRAKEFEFIPVESFNRDKIVKDAKRNIGELVARINDSDVLNRVMENADKTKNQVLSFLSIPSANEISQLSKKIKRLESKVNTLSKKAA
jgi:hypothetical protein